MEVSFWRENTMGYTGGFSGPTSNMVCKVLRLSNSERYGCEVTAAGAATNYYYYRIQTFQNMPTN